MSLPRGYIMDSLDNVTDGLDTAVNVTPPVFLNEEQTTTPDFPKTSDINRELTPDWILYFSIAFLLILAWLRLIYTCFIVNVFKSAFNYQLALKVYNEPGIIQKRIFSILNIFYFLTSGIFFYLVFDYFDYHPMGLKNLKLLGIIITFLISYSLLRILLMKITGALFQREKLFSEAIFHNFLYNKIAGIILIPFILLIAYTRDIYNDIFVFTGLTAFVAVVLMRLIRLIIFIYKSVVLLFYFILYLCTLEILPVLVIIKLIFSLSKGP
ncbi:MAG: DUF4271 domain-containing protein [Bacteroidales bacterium]